MSHYQAVTNRNEHFFLLFSLCNVFDLCQNLTVRFAEKSQFIRSASYHQTNCMNSLQLGFLAFVNVLLTHKCIKLRKLIYTYHFANSLKESGKSKEVSQVFLSDFLRQALSLPDLTSMGKFYVPLQVTLREWVILNKIYQLLQHLPSFRLHCSAC